jgi:hypothetical protein
LLEYEPRLNPKVKGTRPCNEGTFEPYVDYEGYRSAQTDDIGRMVEAILEKLLNLPNSFWMCEPEFDAGDSPKQTVRHGNLCLTFSSRYDVNSDRERLVVTCWYKFDQRGAS